MAHTKDTFISGPENPSLLILSEQPIQPDSTICKNQYQRYLITGYYMPGTEICSGNGKENTTDAFWGQIAFDMIPSPVLLPGESYGQRSLVGYSPWDHKRVRYDLATKQQQQQLAKSDLGVDNGQSAFPPLNLFPHVKMSWR